MTMTAAGGSNRCECLLLRAVGLHANARRLLFFARPVVLLLLLKAHQEVLCCHDDCKKNLNPGSDLQ